MNNKEFIPGRRRRSPKFERALEDLRAQIEQAVYPAQDLLPPERVLAEVLGINRQTLRKILMSLQNSGHLRHEPGRGHRVCYQMPRSVASSKEKIACIFYRPEGTLQMDTYYGPIFSHIAEQAEMQENWLTQILSAKKPIAEIAELVVSENIQGLLSLGIMQPEILKQLQSLGIPLVSIDYDAGSLGIDSIVDNDYEGAYQACKLLIQLGHTQIAYIGMVRGNRTVGHEEELSSSHRQRGYLAALKDAGIADVNVVIGASGIGEGERGFNELYKNNPDMTALLCFEDHVAVGAMRAAKQIHLQTPQDMSVIGFGDNRQLNAVLETPLSTVRTGSSKMIGTAAMDLLRKRIREPQSQVETVVLPCELVVRQTTAQCPVR